MNVDLPPTPIIKSKNNETSVKYCVKIKLRIDTMSQKLNLYKLKMAQFDNGKLEKFLLLIRNFNITLDASGTLVTSAKIQLLRTLVHGKALFQFDTLSTALGSTTSENLRNIILVLGTYFFPINVL